MLVGVAVLAAAGTSLALTGGYAGDVLTTMLRDALTGVEADGDVWSALVVAGAVACRPLWMFAVLVCTVAILATWIQIGPMLSVASVTPDFSRLWPGASRDERNGVGRIAVVVLGGLLIAGALTAALVYLLDTQSQSLSRVVTQSPSTITRFAGAMVMKFGTVAGAILIVVALLDAVHVKWRWWTHHHMTREALLAERRRDEVDPRIRRARRRLHYEISTEPPPRSAQ